MAYKCYKKPCTHIFVFLVSLLCQSTASAKTQIGKVPYSAYAMSVDYNPKTGELTGLFQVDGHSCWLLLDTGYFGVELFADRQADWNPENSINYRNDQRKHTHIQMSVRLSASDFLPPEIPVDVVDDVDNTDHQTSMGQPITGIIGIPLLDIIPIEWNVPKRKIVFWLRGRPDQFRHVPSRAIIICRRDRERRLLVPVSLRGKHSEAYFDTGCDELYVFDGFISSFPVVGPEGIWTGSDLKFRFVPRDVQGLKIGPLTFSGTIGGRLPKSPTKGTPYPHGMIGMSLISRLHLLVVGNEIIFDPHSEKFSSP